MKTLITSIVLLLSCQIGRTQIVERADFSIGERIEIQSEVLQEQRTINIYLPNGYEKDTLKDYPVIYLLDGSKEEDFIHIAGLVQFCSFSWINIIPESIIVGIGNVDRKRDFTYPSDNKLDNKELPTSGKSEQFIKFISDELQTTISENYRVRDEKTIIGQSLGGLLATEILFKQPDLFDNYIIVSPSLWWDDESLLKQKFKALKTSKSIYIGVGKEGPTMERLAKELHDKLDSEKGKKGRLFYGYFEQLDHGDTLHLAVYDAFEKLFKPVKEEKSE